MLAAKSSGQYEPISIGNISTRNKEFLTKLADLMDEYGATLHQTIDDDGIHVLIKDTEIFVVYLDDTKDLRTALNTMQSSQDEDST